MKEWERAKSSVDGEADLKDGGFKTGVSDTYGVSSGGFSSGVKDGGSAKDKECDLFEDRSCCKNRA